MKLVQGVFAPVSVVALSSISSSVPIGAILPALMESMGKEQTENQTAFGKG